jgi:prepilin peptidase CpaA
MASTFAEITLRALLPALFVYACFSDLFTMRISNRLCLTVAAAFPLAALVIGLPLILVLTHVASGMAMLVCAFVLFAAGVIGGGDAKFFAAAAIWIGFDQLVEYLALASVFGGMLTLAIIIMRRYPLPMTLVRWPWALKLHDPKTGVPYGIALGAAAIMLLPHSAVWRAVF